MFVPRGILEEKLRRILAEDIGEGDVTTSSIVPPKTVAEAEIISNETGTVAGIEEAEILSETVGLRAKAYVEDGDKIEPGQVLLSVAGNARAILSVERTMLNVLARMSGIATATASMVEEVRKAGAQVRIAGTRKTAPGLLYFDKKAVLLGGGDPHRLHLDDMVLIKDNHLAIIGSVEKAVKKARENASFSKKIEAEVTRVADALKAAEAGADIIMLDNFSPKQIKEAVKALKNAGFFGKILLEVSGWVTAENLLEYASAQVNIISMGELTHSVKALDISLEITKVK